MSDAPLGADHPFVRDLEPNAANRVPLTPVSFLERSALVWPDKVAVRHGPFAYSYRDFEARCRRLASALSRRGVGRGDTVAVMAPNIPPMLEAHYAVPALGAVLNALNYRQDAATIAFCLDHGGAKVLMTDAEYAPIVKEALARSRQEVLVVDLEDPEGPAGAALGTVSYEDLLAEGDPSFAWPGPHDEWDSLALLYTSGTTGDPKGVVYHHRGAYLNALGNALAFGLAPTSVYLWTLPMFHCSGWTYTWAVTAAGGTHVCLRRVDPALIFPAIRDHRVTHLCGAPIVLNMLVHAPDAVKLRFDHVVDVATGGAAPPSAVIEAMEKMGFRVTHLYGLTESYGPATLCAPQPAWAGLPLAERAQRMARQGVPMPTLAAIRVADAGNGRAGAERWCDARRADAARQHGDEGLSQEREGEPRRLRRRLVPHRRPRGAASGRLRRDQGPREGHHHLGRRERELARGRGMPLPAPGRDGSGRRCAAGPEVGRDAMRVRHAQAGRSGRHRSRHHRVVPGAPRALQGAASGRLRAAAEDVDREDPEVRAARASEAGGQRPECAGRIRGA